MQALRGRPTVNGAANGPLDAADPRTGTSETSAENDPWVQTVLAEGQQLASGDRWSEALTIYQAALRKAPQSRTLLRQRQTARIHVDLRGRLTDAKYVNYARTDSVDMALAHLEDILYKIELNHLDQPNWSEIFRHGMQALSVALTYPDFQTKFLGRPLNEQPQDWETRLQATLGGVSVRNHAELIALIREVARELERQIGLRASVVLHEFAGNAASALDTYSTFLSPGQFDDLNSQIYGNFVGIGVELRTHADHLEIIKAIPGGPADQARIRGGDKMLAINDRLVSAVGGDQAADLLRGSVGSTVTVVVETPEGKQYRLKLQRARVDIPSIEEARMLDAAPGIGYIKLSNFQKNTPADFDRSLRALQQQGIQHLILDLRDNPGGALDAAVAIADRFLSHGTLVITKGRSLAENMTYTASSASFAAHLPLTVLINEQSASASEILAGAIADHKRGTIIGQPSFGKGMVQTILPLTSGRGGIRLTTAEYFPPSGRRVEMQGVTPDLIVQTTARPVLPVAGEPSPNPEVPAVPADEVLAAAVRRALAGGQQP
jgi:carboxyl-terminal processing protease